MKKIFCESYNLDYILHTFVGDLHFVDCIAEITDEQFTKLEEVGFIPTTFSLVDGKSQKEEEEEEEENNETKVIKKEKTQKVK